MTEPPFFGGEGAGVAVTRRRGGRALHGASRIPRSPLGFSAGFRLRSSVSAQNFVFGGIPGSSGGELRQILYRTIHTPVFLLEVQSSILIKGPHQIIQQKSVALREWSEPSVKGVRTPALPVTEGESLPPCDSPAPLFLFQINNTDIAFAVAGEAR